MPSLLRESGLDWRVNHEINQEYQEDKLALSILLRVSPVKSLNEIFWYWNGIA